MQEMQSLREYQQFNVHEAPNDDIISITMQSYFEEAD